MTTDIQHWLRSSALLGLRVQYKVGRLDHFAVMHAQAFAKESCTTSTRGLRILHETKDTKTGSLDKHCPPCAYTQHVLQSIDTPQGHALQSLHAPMATNGTTCVHLLKRCMSPITRLYTPEIRAYHSNKQSSALHPCLSVPTLLTTATPCVDQRRFAHTAVAGVRPALSSVCVSKGVTCMALIV